MKPSNIMIASGDVVKLTDFGIAHADSDTRLTRPGFVLGTQAYMAPEQFRGGAIKPAADMWSLGATLYHAAEGVGPFDRDSAAATLSAILTQDPPHPTCRGPLADAISALLVRDPARRADSARIRAILHGPAEETRTAPGAGADGAGAAATPLDEPAAPRPEPPKPPGQNAPAAGPAAQKKQMKPEDQGCLAVLAIAVVAVVIWQVAAHHHANPPQPGPTSSASTSGAVTAPTPSYGQELGISDFALGQCVDDLYITDSNGENHPTLADCTEPHDGQIIAMFTLNNQADGSDGVGGAECENYAEQEFQGSGIPTGYSYHLEWPVVQAWDDGYHKAACIITGAGGAQITGLFTPISS